MVASRRDLARALEAVEPFRRPDVALEQYLTPPEVAASLVHEADLRGELAGRVIDLGAGTGMFAIAAALRGATATGVERDGAALQMAAQNADALGVAVDWVHGDVRHCPICTTDATVLMNPPFGSQHGARGADRPFLAAAAEIAAVSYSIHNAESRSFVEGFAAERGGRLTHAFSVALCLPRQFAFHTEESREIEAEAYRIAWA